MSDPIIRCEDVSRRFGARAALDGISLEVQPGRCFGFLGPNGAGKTTLIRCILGLARPTSGRITVRGFDIAENPAAALSRVGAIVEEPRFYGYLSGRQNLELWAAYTGGAARERVEPVLDRVGLMPRAGDKVSAYSLGMRQRLGVARALLSDPELLVLDEPTSGLDPLIRREFIQTVIGAYQDADPGERTVLVSTHLISEFEGLIDRFTILDAGKAVMTADADEARSRFLRVQAEFAQDPPPDSAVPGARFIRRRGRTLEVLIEGDPGPMRQRLESLGGRDLTVSSLTLEEIFLEVVKSGGQP